jgi:hypothetical protein
VPWQSKNDELGLLRNLSGVKRTRRLSIDF